MYSPVRWCVPHIGPMAPPWSAMQISQIKNNLQNKVRFEHLPHAAQGPMRWNLVRINSFMPTVAFNICCPRDCVSRHNGGTAGAPLKPLRDDSALRALPARNMSGLGDDIFSPRRTTHSYINRSIQSVLNHSMNGALQSDSCSLQEINLRKITIYGALQSPGIYLWVYNDVNFCNCDRVIHCFIYLFI